MGGHLMQAYEFNAVMENGFIPVPEPYRSRINKNVKVIIFERKSSQSEKETKINKADLLLPPSLDTRGWKFDKEEANER
jgi:hypothetical protein